MRSGDIEELETLANGRGNYGALLSSSISSSDLYDTITNSANSVDGNLEDDTKNIIISNDAIQLATNIRKKKTANSISSGTTRTDPIAIYSNQVLIANLFNCSQSYLRSSQRHPKTMPNDPPEKRFARHRNPRLRLINEFRHWWKTSRLLVRIAGTLVLFFQLYDWDSLLPNLVHHKKRKGFKNGLRAIKALGRGGPLRSFLQFVHPFTRTIRLYMAIMRGVEARVDDRFWEVLIAEAMAFMGNRSIRWWARHLVDWSSEFWIIPLFAAILVVDDSKSIAVDEASRAIDVHSSGEQGGENDDTAAFIWKIVILIMGLWRGILPFMSSFWGSRIGRSTVLAASERINFRWKTVQYAQDFVVSAGTYRPTNDDRVLVEYAKNIATAIGDGKDPQNVKYNLSHLGFEIVGCGAGGYAMYRTIQNEDVIIDVHITPYGPSILDEMPRYILLERKKRFKGLLSNRSNDIPTDSKIEADAILKGFSFSGAFFTFQEWAALKTRHDNEHLRFNTACKYMGHKSISLNAVDHYSPPEDLVSLKTFIRTGQRPKKQKRSNNKWSQVMKQQNNLARKLCRMEKKGVSPKGVIIYMEGLDCAGKSSTGGLIMQALEEAGYDISQVQYNKPPTPEERAKPWMWRFKLPSTILEGDKPKKSALVWDRGPAGDFVYGDLNGLPQDLKVQRYIDFHKFEEECISNGILFCKLMFVTSKDSISKTLGKRLAHKQIVRDLHTWLDANSSNHSERAGLQEIENHIDPSDFVALNNYDYNKEIFCNFVLHTDHISRLRSDSHNVNPWLIINTSDRHRARIQIMKSFAKQLDQYAKSIDSKASNSVATQEGGEIERLLIDNQRYSDWECNQNKGNVFVALKESFVYILLMLMITTSYLHQTWKIGF